MKRWKVARNLNGEAADREAIQAKIDLYLKEIDICLQSFGDKV